MCSNHVFSSVIHLTPQTHPNLWERERTKRGRLLFVYSGGGQPINYLEWWRSPGLFISPHQKI
jgi:hypothetical protein